MKASGSSLAFDGDILPELALLDQSASSRFSVRVGSYSSRFLTRTREASVTSTRPKSVREVGQAYRVHEWQSSVPSKMVLQEQTAGLHNRMLGQKIEHPASTNFDDSWVSPAAKRLKRHESTDSSLSRRESDGEIYAMESPKPPRQEVPDSEDEGDGEEIFPGSQTDLESSLPPVKTDKEAIANYESMRATEQADVEILKERVGQGKWTKGQSSIYVDAFNLALETVLEDESHLFDEAETALFGYWKSLSYQAQYLYVRLFLRKTAAWFRINRIGYYSDVADLAAAIEELTRSRDLPASSAVEYSHPGELEPPIDSILGASTTFADKSEDHISGLEEASSLLLLDELKTIAKEVKAQGKNKKELLQSLRRTSQSQSGLGWRGLKRSDTEESARSTTSGASEDLEDGGANRDAHLVRKIMSCTGDCIRLSAGAQKLFERVHLVFYRSTEWTEKSLTVVILSRISRRNFPPYVVSRSTNIFTSRAMLLEFEASVRTQFRVDEMLEGKGKGPIIETLEKLQEISEDIYPRWKALVAEEQQKEGRLYESGEGAYLRRFSPAWVYTRIVHKGLASHARFKEHKKEHELLVELLDQRLFHPARRGAWYQRKALLEEHYMWALEPTEGRSEDTQKRHWKRIALETCETGLQDKDCHLINHYDLQKRIVKIEKSLKVPKREQHDFGHALLANPFERTVEGTRIEKEIPVSGKNGHATPTRRGAKTVWVDEQEGDGECGVEAMCLSWYRNEGWKGFHSEGGIIRTLFAYLFCDVLFTYVPNVFQTEYQTCPLDLFSDTFFQSRLSEIHQRLNRISNGDARELLRQVHDQESAKETCIVGLDWSYAIADLEEIAACFPGEALAAVCKVMAQEYQQRGGGIPDLFLWHPERRAVMFAEVKSENDRLSDTQRLWIHVLLGAGVRVELCNAVAREVRKL